MFCFPFTIFHILVKLLLRRSEIGQKKYQFVVNRKDERITEYTDSEVIEELIPQIEIPKQSEFYKIPRRFGSIPVDELPLGCNRENQYSKIYPRIRLPFQKANRVTFGYPDLDPNRLFWGDNLHVMRMLPSNSIDLIYIDPPFFSGKNYNIIFGDQNEIRSFTDIWEGGMPSYLIWLNSRLLEMKRLLKPNGIIHVHLDWHASHYVKIELDKIFGSDNFIAEIIWERSHSRSSISRNFRKAHDTILKYSKGHDYTFNQQYKGLSDASKKLYVKKDDKGIHRLVPVLVSGVRNGETGKSWRGINPNDFGKGGMHWVTKPSNLEKYEKDGLLVWPKKVGGLPQLKYYLEQNKGVPISDLWMDVGIIEAGAGESLGYPTQKPESLLERIIYSSSNEGDIVADFFCGGGTTPAVSQKLNRRWIACDQSRVAVAITQGRLESLFEDGKKQITLTSVPDISIEYWGTYEVPELENLSDDEFKNFIISAYGGRPSTSSDNIHGFKKEMPIFVGSSKQDSQVTKNEVVNFAKDISEKRGKKEGIMLGWSFAQSARTATEKLLQEGEASVDLIQISLTEIESSEFREHITKLHDEYNSFLKFILPPEVIVHHKKIKSMIHEFDATESISLNTGASIVNVQWDLDYRGRFTPTVGFAYGRDQKGKPLFKIQYEFEHIGKTTIACRVQDDLGGEKIYTEVISVS